MCYAFNIMIPNFQNSSNKNKGSSLNFSAHGGWGKEKNCKPAEKIAVGSEGEAEGGCGGNSASPEPKRSPAALLVQSRAKQKNFLFLLEEKIRRAQNQKSKGNFSARHASGASGSGAERQFLSKKFRAKFRISHYFMDTKKLGNFGEEITCHYLKGKGYKILERNFVKNWDSKKKGEIDIVAEKEDVISFVEVKTARGKTSGGFLPEDRVGSEKQRKLTQLAEKWLVKNKMPLDSKWQIDVVSIRVDFNSKKAKIRHLKNAF